jgi:hypothetical protein
MGLMPSRHLLSAVFLEISLGTTKYVVVSEGETSCGIIAQTSMKQPDQSNHPLSAYSVAKVASLVLALFGIIKSGVSPTEVDSKTWYDRAIRVVGGIIILLLFGTGFALLVAEQFRHSK